MMKIILSPSKLQRCAQLYSAHRPSVSPRKSSHLRNRLKCLNRAELKVFFGLSDALTDQVYRDLHSSNQAICDPFAMYTGIVFNEINAKSYDDVQLAYLLRHGVVLSALYGPLEADMACYPYRLDMTKPLSGINLYQYWQPMIKRYFKAVTTVVNLASLEFSRLLKDYRGRQLNIYFTEEQSNGTHKIITVRAKQARGLMFDNMVRHGIEDLADLKGFEDLGYRYCQAMSTDNDWYFVKEYGHD